MTNEEFLANLTKGLNDFLVEMVRENDKRADKIEKMIVPIKREINIMSSTVDGLRRVICRENSEADFKNE